MNKQEKDALLAAFEKMKKVDRTFILRLAQALAKKHLYEIPAPKILIDGDDA